MRFYSTALLILLLIPGVVNCLGCLSDIETESCKAAREKLVRAQLQVDEAKKAYEWARENSDDADYINEMEREYLVAWEIYRTHFTGVKGIGCL